MDRFKNVGYLLKDVSRRYVARFERHAEEVSLTLMQCKVLLHLSRSEGASQVRLCELTDIEPMMMVRILDRMEADKMLERRPDPAEGRALRAEGRGEAALAPSGPGSPSCATAVPHPQGHADPR